MRKIASLIIALIFTQNVICITNATARIDCISIDEFSLKLTAMLSSYSMYNYMEQSKPRICSSKRISTLSADQNRKFASMRLLVNSRKTINTLDAVSVISGYRDIWVLQFVSVADAVEAYDYYAQCSYINSVEPDVLMTASEIDEATDYSEESGFLSWGAAFAGFDRLLNAVESRPMETVSVAVIDSGVGASHPRLQGRVEETHFNGVYSNAAQVGSTADDNGHGTHVAGIIADCTTENVRIRPYKVLDATGTGYTSVITAGIYQAVEDGVCAINLSLGSRNPSPIQEAAIDFAEDNDILVVCAAGNRANTQLHYPACYENAIAVASVANDGQLSFFSCYGDFVDISAPGSDIVSTYLDGTYKSLNGTSMAAPFVTAACAMAKALHGRNTNDKIKALMYSSATMTTEMETDDRFYGYGLLQADGILRSLPENVDSYLIPSAPVFSVAGEMYKDEVSFTISSTEDNEIYYTLDGTMPNLNSLHYDGSEIVLSETATVKAAAYSKDLRKSKTVTETYYITHQLPPDEITITEAGVITSCNTNLENVYLPDTIRGIVPVAIASDAFSQRNGQNMTIQTLLLPASVSEIDDDAFYENNVIERISAVGLARIGDSAFEGCDLFESLIAPGLTEIGSRAFRYAGRHKVGAFYLYSDFNLTMPLLVQVGDAAFQRSSINYFEAPMLTAVGEAAFYSSRISGICCDRLTVVPDYTFDSCNQLMEIELPGARVIGEWAFTFCSHLTTVHMPACREIKSCSFYNCTVLTDLYFPSLVRMAADSFDFSENIWALRLPSLEEIYAVEGGGTMVSLSARVFYAPKLKSFCSECFIGQYKRIEIPGVEEIHADDFISSRGNMEYLDISGCRTISSSTAFASSGSIGLINAPRLVSAASLPNRSAILTSGLLTSLPADLEEMTFYGVPGSYAEQYANENGHIFIPIPYIDNESVPDSIDREEIIVVDVIGYNLIYQWFASYDGSTENAVLLEGETDNMLDISSVKKAPYYFCVVKCNDKGMLYTSTTGTIRNMSYSDADYSALDDILATVPEDLSIYTDETVAALNEIINGIDRTLDVSEQATVDGYVEAIRNAIDNLQLKAFTVTFFADEQYKYEYSLKYGEAIAKPDEPYKSGYIFKGWTPEIPETMPAYDLSFFAVFDEHSEIAAPTISIKNYVTSRTVDYRTTITFTAISTDMPDNASIQWYIDGEKAGEGEQITVEKAKETFTVQAKVVDDSGKILNSTETELVKVKTDFFSKIIAFFRMLFGKLPVIEQ